MGTWVSGAYSRVGYHSPLVDTGHGVRFQLMFAHLLSHNAIDCQHSKLCSFCYGNCEVLEEAWRKLQSWRSISFVGGDVQVVDEATLQRTQRSLFVRLRKTRHAWSLIGCRWKESVTRCFGLIGNYSIGEWMVVAYEGYPRACIVGCYRDWCVTPSSTLRLRPFPPMLPLLQHCGM